MEENPLLEDREFILGEIAYQIFKNRKGGPGTAEEDWAKAEKLYDEAIAKGSPSVQLHDEYGNQIVISIS